MKKFQITEEDFNRKCILEDSIKFYNSLNEEFGDVTILLDKVTKEEYLMKIKEFFDEEEFVLELRKTINRSNFNHKNLMKFKDYSTMTKDNGKLKKYQIRNYFYYNDTNLKREIIQKKNNLLDFPIEEITYLFFDIIEACFYLQEKNISHSNLSPDLILVTDNSFLLGDRMKFKAKYPQNIIDKFIKNNFYISPEFFSAIKNRDSSLIQEIDKFKSDVFVLGMVFLFAGNLESPRMIYNKKNKTIDFNLLEKLINIFEGRYGNNQLVSIILRKMLIVDPIKRPSFFELKYALPERNSLEKYFFNCRSRKRPIRNISNINNNNNRKSNNNTNTPLINQSIRNINNNKNMSLQKSNKNFNNKSQNFNNKNNSNNFNNNEIKIKNLNQNILNKSGNINKINNNTKNNYRNNPLQTMTSNLNNFNKIYPPNNNKLLKKKNFLAQSTRNFSVNHHQSVDLQITKLFNKNNTQKNVFAMGEKNVNLTQSNNFFDSHQEKNIKKNNYGKRTTFNFTSQRNMNISLANTNQESQRNINNNYLRRNTSFQNTTKNSVDVFGNFENKRKLSKSPLDSFFSKNNNSNQQKMYSNQHNIYSAKNISFFENKSKNKNDLNQKNPVNLKFDFKKQKTMSFLKKKNNEVNYFEEKNTFTQLDPNIFEKEKDNIFKKKKNPMRRHNLSVGISGNRKFMMNNKNNFPQSKYEKKDKIQELQKKNSFVLNNSMINKQNPYQSMINKQNPYQSMRFLKRNSRTPVKLNGNINPPILKKFEKKNSFQIF